MDGTLIEELREIGMTKYQSHAYVAAVSLGTSRPKELSEAADVPQARIYDIIDDLDEMGLIEKQSRGSGTIVSTPAPDVVLNEFRQRHFDDFTNKIRSLSSGLSTLYSRTENSEGFVTMVRSESSSLRHIRQIVEDADWWLALTISSDTYTKVADELAAAVDRGVSVRLILGDDPTGETKLEFPEAMRVRHRGISDVLAIADRSYGIFTSTYPSPNDQPYIVVQETNLNLLYQKYFEQIWPTSAVVQDSVIQWYLEPWWLINDIRDGKLPEDIELRIIGHRIKDRFKGEWTGQLIDYEMSGPVENDYKSALPVVASITVDTGENTLTVGGWKATVEDVAAHAIEVQR